MAYTLGSKCAKNLCKRIVLLQLIIENVVTCFFGTQCSLFPYSLITDHILPRYVYMGGATGGLGDYVPHFWDQLGTGEGVQGGGPMKMIFASTADSLYSVLYK